MTGDRRGLQNFVGGKYADTQDGATVDVVNPSTGEVFATMPDSGPADVDAAVTAADNAFGGWRDATPSERSLALLRIADAIEARAEELVDAECENTGKPKALTMSEEIPPMVDQIRFYAGAARLLEGSLGGRVHVGLHVLSSGASPSACAHRSHRGTTR